MFVIVTEFDSMVAVALPARCKAPPPTYAWQFSKFTSSKLSVAPVADTHPPLPSAVYRRKEGVNGWMVRLRVAE